MSIILLIFFLIIIICFVIPNKQYKTKKIKVNADYSPLSKEKIKIYKGLENITDQEAENIISSLRKYSELTFKRFCEEKNNRIII